MQTVKQTYMKWYLLSKQYKAVSCIAIPSPCRLGCVNPFGQNAEAFWPSADWKKRSKSALVAFGGCSNLSETIHHKHFWNILISLSPFLWWYFTQLSHDWFNICSAIYSTKIFALLSITFQYISLFSCMLLGDIAGCSSSRASTGIG